MCRVRVKFDVDLEVRWLYGCKCCFQNVPCVKCKDLTDSNLYRSFRLYYPNHTLHAQISPHPFLFPALSHTHSHSFPLFNCFQNAKRYDRSSLPSAAAATACTSRLLPWSRYGVIVISLGSSCCSETSCWRQHLPLDPSAHPHSKGASVDADSDQKPYSTFPLSLRGRQG